jgi:hypothetical protein
VQERFVIRYIVDLGKAALCQRFYPNLMLAEDFARSITTDGTTAFPHAASILRQTRRHDLDVWQDDQSFAPIEVKRGQRFGEPGNLGQREPNPG